MREPSVRRLSGPVTRAAIEALDPDQFIWDGKISNLYVLRLRPRRDGVTRASFRIAVDLPRGVARQRIDGKRSIEHVIGRYPDTGIAELRRRAAEAIALIKRGGDPKTGRDPVTGPTLQQGIDRYLDHLRTRTKPARPKTLKAYAYAAAALPKAWLAAPLARIAAIENRDTLRDLHQKLTRDRGTGSADLVMAFLVATIKHATLFQDLPAVPRGIIGWHGAGSRADTGITLAGIAAWDAARQGLKDKVLRELLLFLLLTGLRSSEASEALRTDLRGDALTITAKGGAARTIPLSKPALACCRRAMALHHDPRIFAGRRQDAAREAGVTHGHSLRHSFATICRELGLADADIAALLGHRSGTHAMTARYGTAATARLRRLYGRVAKAIEARLPE